MKSAYGIYGNKQKTETKYFIGTGIPVIGCEMDIVS